MLLNDEEMLVTNEAGEEKVMKILFSSKLF